MTQKLDMLLTAVAPAIWGSTYLVTTELLPEGYPLTVAMLRALPAGVLLLVCARQLPVGMWWVKIFILGALNFSIFWWLLFMAAYRLPGGIAAIFVAISPLIVVFLARIFLASEIRATSVIAAIAGMTGIAVLTAKTEIDLDSVGVIAGVAGAFSMAFGTVLTRHWQPPVPLLTFTAWQLTAGGIILLPAAMWFEPALPELVIKNYIGFIYLGFFGGLITYVLWFRGIRKLDTSSVATLGFISPLAAVILGWWWLGQSLGPWQLASIIVVMASIWLGQKTNTYTKQNSEITVLKTMTEKS